MSTSLHRDYLLVNHEDWLDSISYYKMMIDLMRSNKHFVTPSTLVYAHDNIEISKISSKFYFDYNIKDGQFYLLDNTFNSAEYAIQKNGLSKRDRLYLSGELYILFNAVAIYIFKATISFMKTSESVLPNISSYYGADFAIKSGKFDVDPKRHYFLHRYRLFKDDIFKSAQNFTNILKFDFKDFYSSIDIDLLFNEINDKLHDSEKWEFQLDEKRLESLKYFFEFTMKGKSGIPQYDLNYVCGYIASVYMRFWELDVAKLIGSDQSVSEFRLVRYVDDVYIFFKFKDETMSEFDRSRIILQIGERVADISISKFNIKVNDKTDIFFYSDANAKKKLRRIVKNTSAHNFGDDEDEDLERDPQDLVDSIFDLLDSIIDSNNIFSDITSKSDSESLKSVFDTRVGGLITSGDNNQRLLSFLDRITFDHIKISPRPILALITKSAKHEELLLEQIRRKTTFSTSDEQIALDFLCSTKSSEIRAGIIQHLPDHSYFPQIRQLKGIKYKQESLYELGDENLEYTLNMGEHENLIFQSRQRKVAEWSKKWSLALNHLLNEIDYTHRAVFNKKHKESNVNVLINDLMGLGINADNLLEIRKMFDRRHNNTISHPGNKNTPSLPLNRNEYFKYYRLSKIVISHMIFKK